MTGSSGSPDRPRTRMGSVALFHYRVMSKCMHKKHTKHWFLVLVWVLNLFVYVQVFGWVWFLGSRGTSLVIQWHRLPPPPPGWVCGELTNIITLIGCPFGSTHAWVKFLFMWYLESVIFGLFPMYFIEYPATANSKYIVFPSGTIWWWPLMSILGPMFCQLLGLPGEVLVASTANMWGRGDI